MTRFQLIIPGLLLFHASCSPKVTTQVSSQLQPLAPADEVHILPQRSPLPGDALDLGKLSIQYRGLFTVSCEYNEIIARAREEARKIGGNVIKITDHGFLQHSNAAAIIWTPA
jgi:hypothetical protein